MMFDPDTIISTYTDLESGCLIEHRRRVAKLSWLPDTYWLAYPSSGLIQHAGAGRSAADAIANMLFKARVRIADEFALDMAA
jgi:hypothetical protein